MEIAVFYYREMSVAATSPSAFLFKKKTMSFSVMWTFLVGETIYNILIYSRL